MGHERWPISVSAVLYSLGSTSHVSHSVHYVGCSRPTREFLASSRPNCTFNAETRGQKDNSHPLGLHVDFGLLESFGISLPRLSAENLLREDANWPGLSLCVLYMLRSLVLPSYTKLCIIPGTVYFLSALADLTADWLSLFHFLDAFTAEIRWTDDWVAGSL